MNTARLRALKSLRADFPIFQMPGKRFVYLDSASSAQKPQVVMDAITHFYAHDYANIHRGIYALSARATALYEETRKQVSKFIGAKSEHEIVFVRGTTEGLNLLAQTLSKAQGWQTGDEVILSEMEHHSNIVPWYFLKKELGIELKIIPVRDDGSLDLTAYKALFSTRTKLVSVSHVSNALGTINPVKEMAQIAHAHNVPIALDGAQAAPHMPVNVSDIDCDFYVFSSHKLYGPTGVGVLYGKQNWLNILPPYQGGGDMIATVAFDEITYAPAPQKFEAGTPDIANVVAFAAALNYVEELGIAHIHAHEQQLLQYLEEQFVTLPEFQIIGTAKPKVGVVSFIHPSIHAHDIGTVLDSENIAVRAGHHCAMPLMQRFNVAATVRASLGLYNTQEDIDALIAGLRLTLKVFG